MFFFCFFFLMIRRPPRSTRIDTLFPYTTLFRSESTGLELISRVDLSKKWDVMANVNAFHTRFQGSEAFDIDESEGFSWDGNVLTNRSEEHTSELQSLMRISYAVFCLKKKIK